MNRLNSLQNLFSSNFYIEERYALSFVPSIYAYLNNSHEIKAKSEEDLMFSSSSIRTQQNLMGEPKRVVVLSLKQPIVKYTDRWMGWLGSKTYIRILKQLANDDSVAGVVLDIDSGGGQSYGTPEFYDEIKNFQKPIYSFTDGLMCSAAYYIGNAADGIIAHKRSEAIGSIGAYTQFIDFTGIFEKLGAKSYKVYATESGDKNKEIRELIDNNNPTPYIKNILDPLVTTFHADMLEKRPDMDKEALKGGVWGAEEALQMGLIDEIGTIETAIMKVIESSGNNNNSNTNSNNTEMPEEKSFQKLAAVLGVEGVEPKKANIFSTNETVSLTAEQLSKIEAALSDPNDSQKLADLNSELTKVKSDLANAKNDITNLNTAVENALTKAGLEGEKKETATENIELLADKVVEFGGEDGELPTTVHAEGDKSDGYSSLNSTSIFDSIVN